jgi:hypothetical protein
MKEYFETNAKYLNLNISFPYKDMLKEAKALRHRFVEHRGDQSKGWLSLTLHGHGENNTGTWQSYWYKNSIEASKDLHWTKAALECPITLDFLKNHFPCEKFGRVRFMLLEAGGYIGMHSDSNSGIRLLENINLSLNNPEGCIWSWQDGDPDVFMEPGKAYAMNISYHHAVYNNSNEDRYHMIIARHDSTPEWKKLITDAAQEKNVTGQFLNINELP